MRKKYWTFFKLVTFTPAVLLLVTAIFARLTGDVDTAGGALGISLFFWLLFGLLNVDSTFNKGG
jgi:hypothetical protein